MAKITNKNFSSVLNGLVKSETNVRDNVNNLILFGLETYQQHSDTSKLSQIVDKVKVLRSVNGTLVKDFIKAHANVKYGKVKDGTFKFSKDGKDVTVTIPTVEFYNWNKTTKPKAEKTDAEKKAQYAQSVAKRMADLGMTTQELLSLIAKTSTKKVA